MSFMVKTPYLRQKFGRLILGTDCTLFTNAGAPTNSVTGAGFAGIGSLCVDTTNGKAYINTGTKATPTWTVVGAQT
jgi:hypothetical protein